MSRISTVFLMALTVIGPNAAAQDSRPAEAVVTEPVADKMPSSNRAEFPLPDGFPVVVPVGLRGTEYQFVFDTGCTVTSVNQKHKGLFGRYIKSYNSSGSIWQNTRMDVYAIPDGAALELGPLQIKGEMGAMDYSALGDWLTKYDGLVGIDFMEQFIVQFDFEAKRLRLLNRDTKPSPEWATPLEIDLVGGTPHLEVRLTDSISERFMIDSGSPFNYLDQVKFEALMHHFDSATTYKKQQITRETKDFAGILMKEFRLGPLTYDKLRIVEYPRSFLGMEFLRRHTVVMLDCSHRRLYLKKKEAR
jgi:hypothetical protein